jgi:integrase
MSVSKYHTSSGEPRWRVEWRLPGRVKRRRVFHTAAQARRFESEVIASAARGLIVDPKRGAAVTVDFCYRRWLASRADYTPKVLVGYQGCYRVSVGPAFGAWPLTAVDAHSVQEWVNAMAGDVGPRTQRWRHSVLRMVMQYAVDHDYIVKNPCAATRFPPLARHEHVYLTPPEVERLAGLCGPQGDVVTFLAYTGLRWGELMGLCVADVDLPARRIRVRRSITQVGGKLVTGGTKSKAGVRTVPIPNRIVPLLEARSAGRAATEPAITSPRGALLIRENWVRAVSWNEQRKALGRPKLRIHDLRHTYASLARAAGADLRLLQKTLGHASITVTAHTYADLYDSELDAIADALDRLNPAIGATTRQPNDDGPPQAHHAGQLMIDDELIRDENTDLPADS